MSRKDIFVGVKSLSQRQTILFYFGILLLRYFPCHGSPVSPETVLCKDFRLPHASPSYLRYQLKIEGVTTQDLVSCHKDTTVRYKDKCDSTVDCPWSTHYMSHHRGNIRRRCRDSRVEINVVLGHKL